MVYLIINLENSSSSLISEAQLHQLVVKGRIKREGNTTYYKETKYKWVYDEKAISDICKVVASNNIVGEILRGSLNRKLCITDQRQSLREQLKEFIRTGWDDAFTKLGKRVRVESLTPVSIRILGK